MTNPNKLSTKTSVMALLEAEAPMAETAVAEAPAPAAKAPLIPTTKAQLLSYTETQLDNAYDAYPNEVPGWYDLNLDSKQKALGAALFGKKKLKAKPEPVTAEAAPAPVPASASKAKAPKAPKETKAEVASDPITKVAGDIENLTTQDDVEQAITLVLSEEGLNDFRLGGLFQKLMEVAQFGENVTFRQYVSDRFGVEYRKARYLIQNYNGLMAAGIAWDDVRALGWTKTSVLIPILTAENVAEWVQKALSVNKETLKEMVKAAQQAAVDGVPLSNEPVSNMTTKTFTLAADQVELLDLAIEDAKGKGSTEHNGVALEYICNAYLNSDLSNGDKDNKLKAANAEAMSLKKQLAAAQKQVAELDAKLAALTEQVSGEIVPDPKQLYAFAAKSYTTKAEAIAYLFGPEFDEVFPGVVIDVNILDEAAPF